MVKMSNQIDEFCRVLIDVLLNHTWLYQNCTSNEHFLLYYFPSRYADFELAMNTSYYSK